MHSETLVYPKEVDNEKLIHANRVYEEKKSSALYVKGIPYINWLKNYLS